MAKSIIYDCYAYFAIDNARNMYPIKDAECHIEKILSLKNGDVIFIKGKGHLQIIGINVDDYDYEEEGETGLFQQIAIACIMVDYRP